MSHVQEEIDTLVRDRAEVIRQGEHVKAVEERTTRIEKTVDSINARTQETSNGVEELLRRSQESHK